MNLRISPGKQFGTYRILVDEEDISEGVTDLNIGLEANQLPQVTLTLDIINLDSTLEGVDVIIPDATAVALKALGWTPPKEDT
jgi:hypothetical protein